MKFKQIILMHLIIGYSILSGCTVLDYESTSTTTESTKPAPVAESNVQDLKAKVKELEQRIEVLEGKLKEQW